MHPRRTRRDRFLSGQRAFTPGEKRSHTGIPIVRHTQRPPEQPVRRTLLDEETDEWELKWQEFLSRLRTKKRKRKIRAPRGHGSFTQQNQQAGRKKKLPSFLRDGAVRTALLVCAFVSLGSVIAIPTALARQTTDITINDGGRILAVSTAAQTVSECLSDNRIELEPGDVLAQNESAPITAGMEIKIWRASRVTVNSEGESTTLSMVSGTVEDALNAVGVTPDPLDEVYPSLDTPVRAGMRVEHIAVSKEESRHTYDIPYGEVEIEDPELPKGETRLVQGGENGTFEIVTETVYKNGVVFSQTVLSEETLEEPKDEITAVGTYVPPPPEPDPPTISEIHGTSGSGSGASAGASGSSGSSGGGQPSSGSSGGSSSSGDNDEGSSGGASAPTQGGAASIDGVSAKYTLTMQTTAYCKACDSGNGKTASGTYAQWGTVAANTGVLPFGTKIYVPGYGYGVVEDTGGFGSNVIDLYLGDRDVCTCGEDWGRQTLTIYVLG